MPKLVLKEETYKHDGYKQLVKHQSLNKLNNF